MTKRSPEKSSPHASTLSLRQGAAPTPTPPPAPPPAPVSGAPALSKHFLLADMDGRPVWENLACASCIAKLAPRQKVQVCWHVSNEGCQLCQVAACKPEAFTKPFCHFLQENPTVFHAVDYFERKLGQAGFQELSARDAWAAKVRPGGKYWVTRNGSSLVAFSVGKAYRPGNGIAMIAGHVDALTARLKPISTRPSRAGFVQLGVAPYAGGLNPTWWDRDLNIGGCVVVRDEATGRTSTRLVKFDWPMAKIPTLAPHFGRGMFGENNKETQTVPIIGLESPGPEPMEPLGPPGSFVHAQPPRLVKLVAQQLGVQSHAAILDWNLELFDCQPAQTCGMDREFITAGRIDDKLCSWAAMMGLLASDDGDEPGNGDEPGSDAGAGGYIKLVALFDDEEIGSLLRQGARGNLLPLVIERAVEALSTPSDAFGPGLVGRTYARSFLISADVTHAANPNFPEAYLAGHEPRLNVGVAIVGDSNGNSTTDAVSTAILRRVADLSGARTQPLQIRNDTQRRHRRAHPLERHGRPRRRRRHRPAEHALDPRHHGRPRPGPGRPLLQGLPRQLGARRRRVGAVRAVSASCFPCRGRRLALVAGPELDRNPYHQYRYFCFTMRLLSIYRPFCPARV